MAGLISITVGCWPSMAARNRTASPGLMLARTPGSRALNIIEPHRVHSPTRNLAVTQRDRVIAGVNLANLSFDPTRLTRQRRLCRLGSWSVVVAGEYRRSQDGPDHGECK
jgi:hypothetical protein